MTTDEALQAIDHMLSMIDDPDAGYDEMKAARDALGQAGEALSAELPRLQADKARLDAVEETGSLVCVIRFGDRVVWEAETRSEIDDPVPHFGSTLREAVDALRERTAQGNDV